MFKPKTFDLSKENGMYFLLNKKSTVLGFNKNVFVTFPESHSFPFQISNS